MIDNALVVRHQKELKVNETKYLSSKYISLIYEEGAKLMSCWDRYNEQPWGCKEPMQIAE